MYARTTGSAGRTARSRSRPRLLRARALRKSLDDDGPNATLERLLLAEQFRVVVPAGIEESLPNLLTDLSTGDARTRVEVLRSALVETGPDLYPLLGLLLLDKSQPGSVRSFSIEVLGRMHRVRELIEAYKVAEGQAQFAIAIALGDNGVYIGIPTLIEALELPAGTTPDSHSVTAQEIAARRLREYSGENFGYSVPWRRRAGHRDRAVAPVVEREPSYHRGVGARELG